MNVGLAFLFALFTGLGFLWGWLSREAHAKSKALVVEATDDDHFVVKHGDKEIARDLSFADAIHAAMMHNAPAAK